MKTINNPNPIGKMKTINNPNPIASIGRINFKKVISAILLFSLLFFSLLAGANSLQAQERKTGWFVGISPYAMDLNLKKTTRQTTNFSSTGTIVYDATVRNDDRLLTFLFRKVISAIVLLCKSSKAKLGTVAS